MTVPRRHGVAYPHTRRVVATEWTRTGRVAGFAARLPLIVNPLTRSDVRRLQSRLARLLPEFERLGRGDWFDEMMERFDKPARKARGTTDLLSGSSR
ncbi:hypothetical protein ACFO4E_04175 [Nocardiopsis mangrovi]|uniref:Uncharacterized protein n=1 Tax=Nocardiopsis mangrovi TaxID=1179818 RepID=A0ABV9DRN3_9ACTN